MAPRTRAKAETEPTEQTAPEPTASTQDDGKAPRKHHDYNAVLAGLGDFEEAEPIERKTKKLPDIPEDHALVKAFRATYDKKRPLKVNTADVAGTQALLRRIANQLGYGVRLEAKDGGVVFQAKDRTKRVRKAKAEAGAATSA